jgi:hypothetical protein
VSVNVAGASLAFLDDREDHDRTGGSLSLEGRGQVRVGLLGVKLGVPPSPSHALISARAPPSPLKGGCRGGSPLLHWKEKDRVR